MRGSGDILIGAVHKRACLRPIRSIWRNSVGRDGFYHGFLASQRSTLLSWDEDFARMYSVKLGRPSVPPSLLATALVLQACTGISDEEARQRACYDLRWKVALGIEVETRPFAKSTLQEFRAQLIIHEEQGKPLPVPGLDLAKRQRPVQERGSRCDWRWIRPTSWGVAR